MVRFAPLEIWLSEAFVKKLFFALMATAMFAGCATNTDQHDALETRVTALESQVGSASSAAEEAATAAHSR